MARLQIGLDCLSEILAEIHDSLEQVDREQFEALVKAVREAKRLFVTGRGRSRLMAAAFAMRVMHLGWTTHVVGEPTAPAIGAGDLLVACSGSGATPGTVSEVQQARQSGARVAGVTAVPDSPLGSLADVLLCIPGASKASRAAPDLYGGARFEQALLLTLDGVVRQLVTILGMDIGSMSARHANIE